ncbi:MAG: DNA-binding transcriptional regulator [bacterium]
MDVKRRIAVLVTTFSEYERQIIRGIYKYGEQHPLWEFRRFELFMTGKDLLTEWAADGIISFIGGNAKLETVARNNIPLVNTSSYAAESIVPRVIIDNAEIGRQAAEYFLGLGFRHCAYFGIHWGAFSQIREDSFCAKLAQHGVQCSVHRDIKDVAPSVSLVSHWTTNDDATYAWIHDLPKPVGILAWSDVGARHLANICIARQLSIPKEVAILGVDDDNVECMMAEPSLSSIRLCGENIGYEAARMLEQLMAGEEPPSRKVRLPPMGVVARASTDTMAISDPDVLCALRFIHENTDKHIGVDDVLAEVPLSRSALEVRFRRVMGCTLLEEISRARIELAKKLLTGTEMPIRAIAVKAGFRSVSNLYNAFNKTVGMTPAVFRKNFNQQ